IPIMNTTTESTTETLTELLTHLVQFPTVTSDLATNRAALDWVEEQLAGLPLHIKRFEQNGHPSLVATTVKDAKNPKLWLAGHLDVVTGGTKAFKATVRDGRLHGRGAHDMKFALATFIALLRELGQDLTQYDLGLMITTDEEIGGYDGTKMLIEDLGYRGGAALIPDSGGNWEMETGAKGIMWWELTAQGRSAHASRTWEGTNAVDELVKFVGHMRSHLPAEPCGDSHHRHPSINFANLTAPGATNQVPDAATARLDIRFPPELAIEDVKSWISEAETAIPSVRAKNIFADPPYQVKNDAPAMRFREIVREVTGHDVQPTTAHGSSDARHFARRHISTVNICPTGSGFHVPDEWIDIEDLGRFYEITRRFVQDWAEA
ncbi:MAG: peptidase, partial [Patescibacteria group bacterium]|nr:peptidase [Patescibacteria group bacterium]